MRSADGTLGRPGIVMISPQIITINSAPAESFTSRTLMECPLGAPRNAASVLKEYCVFATQIGKFPQVNKMPKDKQILCVFDDVVNYSEKSQEIIKEYYIRGRKHGKGISMCYLSQSFFRIPKIIRLQCNYLILLKLGSKRDLNLILSDYGLGVNKD